MDIRTNVLLAQTERCELRLRHCKVVMLPGMTSNATMSGYVFNARLTGAAFTNYGHALTTVSNLVV